MRTPEAPLVTVVTVVHNGETHLQECINSVLAQTYENWEYVLVDNCSTDRTAEIAKEAASTDKRIRHERHDNFVDVIASHNRGFQAVGRDSRFCKFVGADDWLLPDCLAHMVKLAELLPNIGVVSSYRLNGDRVDLVNLHYAQTMVAGRDIVARSLGSSSSLVGSPTAVLFRADLVRERQPFFDETFRHADSDAAYWALMRADYGLVHQVLTYNRSSLRPTPPTALRPTVSNVSGCSCGMALKFSTVMPIQHCCAASSTPTSSGTASCSSGDRRKGT